MTEWRRKTNKDLGFSLEQIAQLLDENLPAAQIRGMLRMKRVEIQDRVQEEQERLARVEARLRQIEQEGSFSHRGGKLCSDAGVVLQQRDVGAQALAAGQPADPFEQERGDSLAANAVSLGFGQRRLNRRLACRCIEFQFCRHGHGYQHAALNL